MAKTMIMPRTCSCCDRGMDKGFLMGDGLEYFCSKVCLYTKYTEEEYLEMYDDGDGSSYWTDWEEDDADEDDQADEMCAFKYGELAYHAGKPRIPGLDHDFCRSLERSPIEIESNPLARFEQWVEGWETTRNEAVLYQQPAQTV